MRSGYSVGVLAIWMAMAVLALILQNVPALELRRNRLFRLPTELVVWGGIAGFAATGAFAISDFGIYSLTDSIVEDFNSIGFGNASQMQPPYLSLSSGCALHFAGIGLSHLYFLILHIQYGR